MKEIWKPIEGWEGTYEFSNLGRVRTWRKSCMNHNKPLPYYLKPEGKYGTSFGLYKRNLRTGFKVKENLPKYFPESALSENKIG